MIKMNKILYSVNGFILGITLYQYLNNQRIVNWETNVNNKNKLYAKIIRDNISCEALLKIKKDPEYLLIFNGKDMIEMYHEKCVIGNRFDDQDL